MQKPSGLFLLGLLVSVLLNSCEPDRYAAEDELLTSYYSQLTEAPRDSYNIIEQTLLENGIIPDTAAETYNYIIHYVLGNKMAPFEASLTTSEQLQPYLVNQPRLGLDSVTIATIAEKNLNSPLAKAMKSLAGTPFNDSALVEQILRFVTTDDLQHELYRHLALMYTAKTHERLALKWAQEYTPNSSRLFVSRNNTLMFVVDSLGTIKYNDQDIALADVSRITHNFMTRDSSKANWVETRISLIGKQPINTGVVIIGVSPKADDEKLVKVYDHINQVYTQKRKEASQRFFKKDYFKLSKNERNAIQLLTRKWISIHELNDQAI